MAKPGALLRGGAVVQALVGGNVLFSFSISARHIRETLPVRSRNCDVWRLKRVALSIRISLVSFITNPWPHFPAVELKNLYSSGKYYMTRNPDTLSDDGHKGTAFIFLLSKLRRTPVLWPPAHVLDKNITTIALSLLKFSGLTMGSERSVELHA